MGDERAVEDTRRVDTVGWVGTGRMGFELCKRLLAADVDLMVYNRTRDKAEPLCEHGATVVDYASELAGCDVVFVMVAADDHLVQVLLGDKGLLSQSGKTPEIIIDCSTVASQTSADMRKELRTRGIEFLAAPVSGNPKVAASGKLTLAVSGPESAFEEVEPILSHLGLGVTYVGDGEQARLVKIAHNVMLGVVLETLAEITVLVERGGVSRAAFLAFLNDSVMGSTFSRYKSPALVNLDFRATFTNPMLRKDLQLGLGAGKELGVPMPLAAATDMLVAQAVGAGLTEDDMATLILEQARRSAMTLVPEDVEVDDGLHSGGAR